jgi:hypothetical protein
MKFFLFFFYFFVVGHFCPPGSGSGSTDPIESGSNPDPQPCLDPSVNQICVWQATTAAAPGPGVLPAGEPDQPRPRLHAHLRALQVPLSLIVLVELP